MGTFVQGPFCSCVVSRRGPLTLAGQPRRLSNSRDAPGLCRPALVARLMAPRIFSHLWRNVAVGIAYFTNKLEEERKDKPVNATFASVAIATRSRGGYFLDLETPIHPTQTQETAAAAENSSFHRPSGTHCADLPQTAPAGQMRSANPDQRRGMGLGQMFAYSNFGCRTAAIRTMFPGKRFSHDSFRQSNAFDSHR